MPPLLFARQPEARLSDPEYLRTLTGTYELGGTRMIVSVSGPRLMIAAGGGQPVQLLPGLAGEFVQSQGTGHQRRIPAWGRRPGHEPGSHQRLRAVRSEAD